jgi:hypothetical protein
MIYLKYSKRYRGSINFLYLQLRVQLTQDYLDSMFPVSKSLQFSSKVYSIKACIDYQYSPIVCLISVICAWQMCSFSSIIDKYSAKIRISISQKKPFEEWNLPARLHFHSVFSIGDGVHHCQEEHLVLFVRHSWRTHREP